MEDDSLDDFFAKKDKSKKKGKAKVTPGEILAKQDEKPKKKVKRKKEEKPADQESSEDKSEKETKAPPPAEEEWAEYQEEEKDYSGLRIQTLQIRDEESDDDRDKRDSGDEEGEEGEKGEGSRGPWNKGGGGQNAPSAAAAAPKEEETPPAEPKPAPEPPKEEAPVKTKYVPPGARSGSHTSASSGPTPLRRHGGKKNAPNLQSEEDFPTLGGAAPADSSDSNLSSFERVRGGGRQMEDERSKGIKLQLGNKFASLGE